MQEWAPRNEKAAWETQGAQSKRRGKGFLSSIYFWLYKWLIKFNFDWFETRSPKVPESTRTILKERQDQLAKDIENYEHMLEEAGDLEKAWNKSGEEMKGINLNGNFYEVASIFESTVDVSADSTEMAHSSYKDPMDRVAFDKLVSKLFQLIFVVKKLCDNESVDFIAMSHFVFEFCPATYFTFFVVTSHVIKVYVQLYCV